MPDPTPEDIANQQTTIGVVDDAGRFSLVPAAQASQLGPGFHLASPAQLSIHRSRQEQAGLLGSLKAAAQGAADTATLGAASWLETATGLRTPEAIQAGEEAHPVSSFVGSAAGVLAPGVPEVVAGLGKGAAALVRGAASPASKLGRIGIETLAHGAGSAVEGAAYGLGQSVHEDALDPDLTVESAMARGGTSALLGAGLGAALGAPIGLVSSVIGKVSGAELADKLEEFGTERDLAATGGNLGRVIERKGGGEKGRQALIALGNEGRDLGIFGRFDTPESVNAKASALMEETGTAQREFADRVSADTAGKPALQASGRKVLQELQAAVADLQKDPFQESAAHTLQGYADGLQRRIEAAGKDGKVPLSELWDIRKSADRAIRWDVAPGPSAVKDTLRSLRGAISDEMDAAITRAGEDSTAWRKLNRTYAVAAELEKLSSQGIKKAATAAPVSFGESIALGAGLLHGGPAGLAAPLAYAGARRYGGNLLGMAARGAAGLLRGTEGTEAAVPAASVEKAATVAPVVEAPRPAAPEPFALRTPSDLPPPGTAFFRMTRAQVDALAALERTSRDVVQDSRAAMTGLVEKGRPSQAPPAPSSAEILKQVQAINVLNNRPELAASTVTRLGAETHEHAPTMTLKAGEVSGRVLSYLRQDAPQVSKPFPMGPELMPDRSALLAFHEKAEALRDPIATLTRAPTKIAVEAIQTVYPVLMEHFRSSLISALADAGTEKVYSPRQRAAFSTILGQDLDGTQTRQMSALSQAAFLASNTATPHHAGSNGGQRRSVKSKTLSERYSPRGGGSLRNP